MKKMILLFMALSVSIVFFSCSGEYDGSMPENTLPKLTIYDTSDIISRAETRVQWYGNDDDGTNLKYYYCLTTDTTMTEVEAVDSLDGLWNETDKYYVDISMPFAEFNSNIMFVDSTTYVEDTTVETKVVFTKFFLYGVDEKFGKTAIVSKIFGRANTRPHFPMVSSDKLDIIGYDEYNTTVGPDSAVMVLRKKTSFWDPIDFKWRSEDDDGEVDLEFKWELWSLDDGGNDIERISFSHVKEDLDNEIEEDTTKVWFQTPLSSEIDSVIFDNGSIEKYSFRVWVRDDAFEESDNYTTINFNVFVPSSHKGILLIDDTKDELYTLTKEKMGNPDGAEVDLLYKNLIETKGYYLAENLPATEDDSLLVYRCWDYHGKGYPPLKEISKYRLIIIQSEDRLSSNVSGLSYDGYHKNLARYLNIGGKVFILGHSALLVEDLLSMGYIEPKRTVFSEPGGRFNQNVQDFFYEYFGIYSYTEPESRPWWSQDIYNFWDPRPPAGYNLRESISEEYYMKDNHDFIGVTPYGHVTDVGIAELAVDSAQVNKYWKNLVEAVGPFPMFLELAVKNNGSVLPGIPNFEAYKGEIIYGYKSIYDEPEMYDLSWTNTNDSATVNLEGQVLHRSGTLATRYIAKGKVYQTALFAFPLIFMDNESEIIGEGKIYDMFHAMIDWFELDRDPFADNE